MTKYEKKMAPYNVYLYLDQIDKLKELAGSRKASSVVRDAVSMILDGKDEYSAGYNRALKDVIEVISQCKEIEVIAVRGKYLSDVLIDQIEGLEAKK